MELEEPTGTFKPARDPRPPAYEPPAVRLLAISDVRLPAPAGLERALDDFYVGLLKFEREAAAEGQIVYRAERWRLVFQVVEVPPPRDDYRPVQIQTPQFQNFLDAIHERQIPYEWQKGVAAGVETLFLQDPSGFWVSVAPIRTIA